MGAVDGGEILPGRVNYLGQGDKSAGEDSG
jgi:hypothetical protein